MRRLLLLRNPSAGSGEALADDALGVLRDTGLELLEFEPRDASELDSLIRTHGAGVDAVVVGGGDGTLNASVEALLEVGRPLGVLPLGTANDFARTMGIPDDLHAACAIVGAGYVRRVDVARANGRPFLNAAGIGLSTRVARRLAREDGAKQRLGPFSYPAAVVEVLRAQRPFRARIASPGSVHELKSIQITVGNGVYYGGGAPLGQDCAIDDGCLDLYSIEPLPGWRLVIVALSVYRGTHTERDEGVATDRGAEFEVVTHPPMEVSLDGEPRFRTPVTFSVAPRALPVLAPRPETVAPEPRAGP
ncbi:MAG: lipid kinase [Pseudomonadota bacterium]